MKTVRKQINMMMSFRSARRSILLPGILKRFRRVSQIVSLSNEDMATTLQKQMAHFGTR